MVRRDTLKLFDEVTTSVLVHVLEGILQSLMQTLSS